MFTIPKLSAPLTKAIRTSEGILVYGLNLVIGATAVTGHLPAGEAATLATVNTLAHHGLRTALKAFAIQKDVGIAAPIAPSGAVGSVLKQVAAPVEHVAQQVEQDLGHGASTTQVVGQIVSDAEEFANQPDAGAATQLAAPAAGS